VSATDEPSIGSDERDRSPRDAAADLKEDEGEKAVDILEDTGIPVTVDEED